eukprot:1469365-Amphidinium_carterae.1
MHWKPRRAPSGLLPVPPPRAVPTHEPALVVRQGAHRFWTDGSGRHSSNLHFCRCGVGYVTDTGEQDSLLLPGCRQSVFRAELLAVVRTMEKCNPKRVVSDCKGVAKTLQTIQSGQKQPKGRHRNLEVRARNAMSQTCQLHWVKAHQTRQAVDEGRITIDDFQGNQEADVVANLGAAAHDAHEPTA